MAAAMSARLVDKFKSMSEVLRVNQAAGADMTTIQERAKESVDKFLLDVENLENIGLRDGMQIIRDIGSSVFGAGDRARLLQAINAKLNLKNLLEPE